MALDQPIPRDAILTVQTAAAQLGMSERYLRDLLAAGRVPGARRLGPGRRATWAIPARSLSRIDRRDRRAAGVGGRWPQKSAKSAERHQKKVAKTS